MFTVHKISKQKANILMLLMQVNEFTKRYRNNFTLSKSSLTPAQWKDTLGQYALTLLAVVTTLCYGLDGQNHFSLWPVVLYGIDLTLTGIACYKLTMAIIASHGANSVPGRAQGKDNKGRISVTVYTAGIGLSFVHPYIGFVIYFIVSALWLVPDKRIEKILGK
jgi:uncharacterized membrane protein